MSQPKTRQNGRTDRLAPRAQEKNEKGLFSFLLNSPSIETSVLALALVTDRPLQRETSRQEIQNTVLATGRRRLN